jgi:hypothetical protein
MSSTGAARSAAVPVSNARAEGSRKNGAKSRGPKTLEGKARSAQNALKHGLRAQKYVVLPEEDAAEFAGLEAAMIEELAPVGALQTVLARRVAIAAWRLARADRIEVELFAHRSWGANANPGLAMIRDGNGTRSFETLLRYRGAAMAEFWRALKMLKALQAEQTAETEPALVAQLMEAHPARPAAAHRPRPSEPERRLEYALPEPRTSGLALHEAPASWRPNEPERQPVGPAHAQGNAPEPNEPKAHAQSRPREACSPQIRPVQAGAAPSSFRANVRAGTGPRSAPGAR